MFRGAGEVVRWLGTASSVLSIVMLVRQALQLDLVAPLETLTELYRAWIELLLGWTEPYWTSLLRYISSLILLDLELHAHWRDVFVLMGLYFASEVKTDLDRRRFKNAAVGVLVGSLIVLVGSLGAGTAPLDTPMLDVTAVSFPMAGFIVYALLMCFMTSTFYAPPGQSWWQTFRYYLLTTASPFVVAAALSLCTGTLANMRLPNPSLIALGSFLVAMTLYWLSRGIWLGLTDRADGQSRFDRFLKAGSTRLAQTMLTVMAGVLAFLLLNAGLKLAGL